MMNPEIKKRWIEALNSDEYKQTKMCLKDSTGFCCLGVLTDLYIKEHSQEWKVIDMRDYYSFSGRSKTLPNCVGEWSGLETDDPNFLKSSNERVYLSQLNDDEGYSFKQIAQVIEKNF